AAEGQPAAIEQGDGPGRVAQAGVVGDVQGAGDDRRATPIGVGPGQRQRPGPELGQAAVAVAPQGGVVQEWLGDRDGVAVGVDPGPAGLDVCCGQPGHESCAVGAGPQGAAVEVERAAAATAGDGRDLERPAVEGVRAAAPAVAQVQ